MGICNVRRGRRTTVVQMLPEFHIPVPSRRDVEIPLHLIPLQTAKHPTAIRHLPPLHPRRLLEVPLLTPHLPKHVPDVRVLLLLLHHLPALQRMASRPARPSGRIAPQHVAGEDPIARRILDVDVEVGAEHGDDDVEVYLEFVGDAFLDGEEVGFVAGVPSSELGEGEEGTDDDEEEGRVAAGGCATGVGGFGFRCGGQCVSWSSWDGDGGTGAGHASYKREGLRHRKRLFCREYGQKESYGRHRSSLCLRRSPFSPQRRSRQVHGL